ncbi:MAG TPA: UDP-N-acetylmuramate dehydrogenase [Clostridia bacterium]|nr:UDP-N-acetylmuramate dehydrogenase [Clostridia bacterium]
MSRHTTFKIGGAARIFIIPADVEAFRKIFAFCSGREIPCIVIGNGSNLLISDRGLDCAVLRLDQEMGGIDLDGDGVVCEAGAPLKTVCAFARDQGLTGLEFAFGIPGTVGGAVFMNAGAYGGEMSRVIDWTEHLGVSGPGKYTGAHPGYGYRISPYTGGGFAVTRVRFSLKPGDREEIDGRMKELLERRRTKQPLEYPSAGSVFKRPPGYFAGTLIENCGLKGLRVGGAAVSQKHAGFIINLGGATCADVCCLIDKIKNEVFQKTGVELESEIKVLG